MKTKFFARVLVSVCTVVFTQSLFFTKVLANNYEANSYEEMAEVLKSTTKIASKAVDDVIEIHLPPGDIVFKSMPDGTSPEINYTGTTIVKFVGAQSNGQPATNFIMDTSVGKNVRFLRSQEGTIQLENIAFTGIEGVNGGVAAKNVIANNCIFTSNHTADGVAGGGAIKSYSGYLKIDNSQFYNNSCAMMSDGGAVAVEYGKDVFITNSLFEGNIQLGNINQYGGAVSIKKPVSGSTILIENSTFNKNIVKSGKSLGRGGAISIFGSIDPSTMVTIDQCDFSDNVAELNQGGAVALVAVTNFKLSNSTFNRNSAARHGGAIYLQDKTTGTIENCVFVDNTATIGHAICASYGADVSVDYCKFIDNDVWATNAGKIRINNSEVLAKDTP